jgi:hypothetical protein
MARKPAPTKAHETEAGGLGALLSVFDRFYTTLDATTVPAAGGGRTVDGIAHAVALSEATDALYGELHAARQRLLQQHGQSVGQFPPGVVLMESDSPDGPWTTIPAGKVNMATMGIGGTGADAILLAALQSATKVAAFPIDKWNAMQAARPGANHQRFHAGGVVSAADLAVLESAAKLLRMKAPAPPTVSVSPELLDRLQRSATPKAKGRERRAKWLAEAMLTVKDHPDWPDATIAERVGINKSQLSRSPEYRAAASMARTPNTPTGSVRVANGGRELEAVDDSFDPNRRASRQWQNEEDTDDRIDREMKETQRKPQRGAVKTPVNRRSGGA